MRRALAVVLLGSANAFLPSLAPFPATHRGALAVSRSPVLGGRASRVSLLQRARPAELRASIESHEEGRKFKIGDAVEAEWLGDDALYPGTIEGYFTEGRYDVKWADPQGMADAQATPEDIIIPFDPVKYYRHGLGAWEAKDLGLAYLCMRTVYICVGQFAKTEQYLEQLMVEPMVKELMSVRNDGNPFAARQSAKERMSDAPETVQRVGDEVEEKDIPPAPEKGSFYNDDEIEQMRGQAQEQNMYQNMWLQYNQAKKIQTGEWHGVWEDYTVSKRSLVKQQVPLSQMPTSLSPASCCCSAPGGETQSQTHAHTCGVRSGEAQRASHASTSGARRLAAVRPLSSPFKGVLPRVGNECLRDWNLVDTIKPSVPRTTQQDRKEIYNFETYLDDEGLPEFKMVKDGTDLVGAFYPMAQANWFVVY